MANRIYMLTNPLVIVALVLAIIWLVPLVCRKIHVPAIVGFILVGIVIGEHGLGWIGANRTIDVLGKMGMLSLGVLF